MATLNPPVDAGRDHVQGFADAPVTLVEYGDYECPHCGNAHPIVRSIQQKMDDRLRFVFRNFPLSEIHPHANHAAQAAEAAGAQGVFWEMHHALFTHQKALADLDLKEIATEAGSDGEKVLEDVIKGTYAARVREDFLSGVRSGVNGTPTFFINGQRYNDAWDEETLLAALERSAGSEE